MRNFAIVVFGFFWITTSLTGCLKDDETVVEQPCVEGETRSADDGCNECVCDDQGAWSCTEIDCNARPCDPEECGPRPGVPDQVCFDGTTAGIGECERSNNGTCGWTRTECPPQCEPGDELEQFNGNSCVCNGAGEYECVCEGSGPQPDCQCLSDGTWACPGGPAMCVESEACSAYYDTCNCSWSCSTSEPPPGACDVECGDTGAMPECDCVDGNCTIQPSPPPVCGEDGGICEMIYDSCSCDWVCTNDAASLPQCDQVCPQSEVPTFTCECKDGECERIDDPVDDCSEGYSCSPYYDTCSCSWTCLGSDEDPIECDQLCPPEVTTPPVCECMGDTCSVGAVCEDGETREADDGCNTCRCLDGAWACTLIACPPEMCRDGETREADDGCNTCTCFDNEWACTERACPPPCDLDECGPGLQAPTRTCDDGSTAGPECVRGRDGMCGWIVTECPDTESESYDPCMGKDCGDTCQICDPADADCMESLELKACNQRGQCVTDTGDLCDNPLPPIPPWLACNTDMDCAPTGCGGEMCANRDMPSPCVALPEHACYRSGITSCGCVDGACGWSNRVELDMCIEDARGNGGFPGDGGRN